MCVLHFYQLLNSLPLPLLTSSADGKPEFKGMTRRASRVIADYICMHQHHQEDALPSNSTTPDQGGGKHEANDNAGGIMITVGGRQANKKSGSGSSHLTCDGALNSTGVHVHTAACLRLSRLSMRTQMPKPAPLAPSDAAALSHFCAQQHHHHQQQHMHSNRAHTHARGVSVDTSLLARSNTALSPTGGRYQARASGAPHSGTIDFSSRQPASTQNVRQSSKPGHGRKVSFAARHSIRVMGQDHEPLSLTAHHPSPPPRQGSRRLNVDFDQDQDADAPVGASAADEHLSSAQQQELHSGMMQHN